MSTAQAAIDDFLAQKRIAVAGVSREPGGKHGGNIGYQRLKERGYEVTLALAQGNAGEGMIGFAGGTRRTTSRLLDGANYPPVRSLFPASHNAEARAALRQASSPRGETPRLKKGERRVSPATATM